MDETIHYRSEGEAAWEMALLPKHRYKSGGRNLIEITKEINRIFHNGEPVRNDGSVASKLGDYKKSLPDHEARKEDELRREIRESHFKRRDSGKPKGSRRPGKNAWVPAEETKTYHRFSEEYFMWMLWRCFENGEDDAPSNLEKIAAKLNEAFHGGRSIRSKDAIRKKLNLYKKSLVKQSSVDYKSPGAGPLIQELDLDGHSRSQVNRINFKYQAVLASMNSMAKQGLYDKIGLPINFILNHIRGDFDGRLYNLDSSYITKMFQEDLVIDEKNPFIIEDSSLDKSTAHSRYVPEYFSRHVLRLSEDKRRVIWSPLE